MRVNSLERTPASFHIFSRDEYSNSRLQQGLAHTDVPDEYVVHIYLLLCLRAFPSFSLPFPLSVSVCKHMYTYLFKPLSVSLYVDVCIYILCT